MAINRNPSQQQLQNAGASPYSSGFAKSRQIRKEQENRTRLTRRLWLARGTGEPCPSGIGTETTFVLLGAPVFWHEHTNLVNYADGGKNTGFQYSPIEDADPEDGHVYGDPALNAGIFQKQPSWVMGVVGIAKYRVRKRDERDNFYYAVQADKNGNKRPVYDMARQALISTLSQHVHWDSIEKKLSEFQNVPAGEVNWRGVVVKLTRGTDQNSPKTGIPELKTVRDPNSGGFVYCILTEDQIRQLNPPLNSQGSPTMTKEEFIRPGTIHDMVEVLTAKQVAKKHGLSLGSVSGSNQTSRSDNSYDPMDDDGFVSDNSDEAVSGMGQGGVNDQTENTATTEPADDEIPF